MLRAADRRGSVGQKTMGYHFRGFCAVAGPAVLADALHTWPWLRGRLITTPFQGIGVITPDPDQDQDEKRYDERREQAYQVEIALPAWSGRHPGVTFVWVWAECFGGHCTYEGYTCRDGAVIQRMPTLPESTPVGSGDAGLGQLVASLGVTLDHSGFFAPLRRGFFD